MEVVNRLPAALLVVALAAGGVQAGTQSERMNDQKAEALAREAMASNDPKLQRRILDQLDGYHFKSTLAKERETVLFAMGYLQDRLGDTARAAVTFHKLEASWPQSPYLPEAQPAMAQAALDHGRSKEAESRLHKALAGDLTAEDARRCQEMLLWCLADQGRATEGIETVRALKPLGTAKPTEKGLVGIMEALCADEKRAEAEGILGDYRRLYPHGEHLARVTLAWGKLLGTTGDTRNAAKVFQKLIQDKPAAAESDEARMALATLLSDGSLPAKDAEGYPDAQALLAKVKKTGNPKEDATRRTLMINLRIAVKERHWATALSTVAEFRAAHPSPGEAKPVDDLRAEAVRGLAAETLEKKEILKLLPHLDGEAIAALSPAQRLEVAQALARKGLPEASLALAKASPAKEQPALTRAALEATAPGTAPQNTLALLPAKGEGPLENLQRAQAAVGLHKWSEARTALQKAKAGPERMQALLLYLTRPLEAEEKAEARNRDIEAWLGKAPEKGVDREPLVLLAADRKARAGEWRAALALYPATPSEPNRGWVALMRATCQARLGQAASAQATLNEAKDLPGFKNERASLARQLGQL
jgi:TolA-binding protein